MAWGLMASVRSCYTCHRCGEPILPGQRAWRPNGRVGRLRRWALCLGCEPLPENPRPDSM